MAYLYRYIQMNAGTGSIARTVDDTTAKSPTPSSGVPALRVVVDSSGKIGVVAYTNTTINSEPIPTPFAQIFTINVGGTTFTHQASLPNWVEGARPFNTNQPFAFDVMAVPLISRQTTTAASGNPIANCVAIIGISKTTPITDNPTRLWPLAVVDNYTQPVNLSSVIQNNTTHDLVGSCNTLNYVNHRPSVDATNFKSVLMGSVESTEASTGTQYRYIGTLLHPGDSQMSFFGNGMAGGYVCQYDNVQPFETGFLPVPSLYVSSSGSGSFSGTFNFVAVFEYVDRNGTVHRSRVSDPYTVTVTSVISTTIKVTVPNVTGKLGQIYVSLYRTKNGGSQYYRLTRAPISTSAYAGGLQGHCIQTIAVDSTSDTTLGANPLLYRQPGTSGTALDRYHGLMSRHCIKHKDRIFYAKGEAVYFSSFSVDGEGPWFNPAFRIQVPGGTGNITGLASMDGMLIVFKRDSIFVIDGDGPPENGGSGTEFSPPRRIHSQFGCIDHQTMVHVPNGIMYRSSRGIELLTRNLKTIYEGLGERIQGTMDAYPYNFGSAFDVDTGRALWLVRSSAFTSLGDVPGDTRVVCYDTVVDAWTNYRYLQHTTSTSYVDGGPSSLCYSTALGGGIFHAWFATTSPGVDRTNCLYKEDWTRGYDEDNVPNSVFVPVKITTAWVVNPQGSKEDRLRMDSVKILARRESNHDLKVEYASDFNRSTYTTIKSFNASETNLTPENLEFQPNKESCQSMKFRITTLTPTVSTSFGTGRQLDIMGISVRVGVKGGGSKLPAAQKG